MTGVQGNFLGWLCRVFRLTVCMIILGFLNYREGEVGVFEDTEKMWATFCYPRELFARITRILEKNTIKYVVLRLTSLEYI